MVPKEALSDMTVAYLHHDCFPLHNVGPWHPECPERVRVIHDRLLSSGLLDWMLPIEAPRATREQVLRAHTARHIDELIALSPSSGTAPVDADTLMSPGTLEAAWRAAGALVKATEMVVSGEASSAFCNVRPPGHHATRNQAMGFCFFNNAAVGIYHALEVLGLERVVLFDFDVHHGNGSEDILAGDERVLMLSTFQRGLYPNSGLQPRGDNIISLDLPAYSGSSQMRAAVESGWIEAYRRFAPQLVFISAGFDAHVDDDLGQLGWSDDDYVWLSKLLVQLAGETADGRIVSTLEGGYDLAALARCVEGHVRALMHIDRHRQPVVMQTGGK